MNYAFNRKTVGLMSITERGEILSSLYKLRADAGALYSRCQEARVLHVGVSVQSAQSAINEAIDDFKPDAPQYEMPPKHEMATSQFHDK